jgi:hypothetical protein
MGRRPGRAAAKNAAAALSELLPIIYLAHNIITFR